MYPYTCVSVRVHYGRYMTPCYHQHHLSPIIYFQDCAFSKHPLHYLCTLYPPKVAGHWGPACMYLYTYVSVTVQYSRYMYMTPCSNFVTNDLLCPKWWLGGHVTRDTDHKYICVQYTISVHVPFYPHTLCTMTIDHLRRHMYYLYMYYQSQYSTADIWLHMLYHHTTLLPTIYFAPKVVMWPSVGS